MRLQRKRTTVSSFAGNYTDPTVRPPTVNKRLALYIIKASAQINPGQLLGIRVERAYLTFTVAYLLQQRSLELLAWILNHDGDLGIKTTALTGDGRHCWMAQGK